MSNWNLGLRVELRRLVSTRTRQSLYSLELERIWKEKQPKLELWGNVYS